MPEKSGFPEVFFRLKSIIEPYAKNLTVVHDTSTHYYLDTRFRMKNKRPLFFGAVRTGKAYVSFHLMPVYACPELLKGLSPELRKRMQGKSCFNFVSVDETVFKELAGITKAGYEKFSDVGFLRELLAMQDQKKR